MLGRYQKITFEKYFDYLVKKATACEMKHSPRFCAFVGDSTSPSAPYGNVSKSCKKNLVYSLKNLQLVISLKLCLSLFFGFDDNCNLCIHDGVCVCVCVCVCAYVFVTPSL